MKISKNNLVIMLMLFALMVAFDNIFWPYPDQTFFSMLALQMIIAVASISPIGTFLLRLLYGSRKLQTRAEIGRLEPLFIEVYEEVKVQNPKINKNIHLYIDDDLNMNAYAINNTITITKGAIAGMTDEELKGVLAHEFGHIRNGDTSLTAFTLLGNTAFLFIFLAIKIIHVCVWLFSAFTDDDFMLSRFFGGISNLAIALFMFLLNAILMINSRANEFQADKFAFELGYGENLLSALYLLDRFDIGHKMGIIEKIKSSHPNTPERIGRLESMITNCEESEFSFSM